MGVLDKQVVMVSGASRGIGLAIAEATAAAGAVTLVAARSKPELDAIAGRIGGRAIQLDFTDEDSISRAAEEAGEVDVLINVAGMNIRKPFEDYTREEIERLMQTNFTGLARLTQLVGRRMIRRRKGKVIHIGSLSSLLGVPYISIYAATKGALGQLTRALAAEWGRHNITVNCIAPGFILTDLTREVWKDEKMLEWLAGSQAIGRLGTPEDISALAVFLASPQSDYITGQIIAVDGGHSTTTIWPFEPHR